MQLKVFILGWRFIMNEFKNENEMCGGARKVRLGRTVFTGRVDGLCVCVCVCVCVCACVGGCVCVCVWVCVR